MDEKFKHIWKEGVFLKSRVGYWRTDTCSVCKAHRIAFKPHEDSPDGEIEIIGYGGRGDRMTGGQEIDCWGGPNPV